MRSADDDDEVPEVGFVEDDPRTCDEALDEAMVGGGETNSKRRSRKARSSRATR